MLSGYNVFSNLELGKLCVQVEKHRCTDELTATQEAKFGRLFGSIHPCCNSCSCESCSFSRGSLLHFVKFYTVDLQGVSTIVIIVAKV